MCWPPAKKGSKRFYKCAPGGREFGLCSWETQTTVLVKESFGLVIDVPNVINIYASESAPRCGCIMRLALLPFKLREESLF